MVLKSLPAFAGLLTVLFVVSPALAVDQLPLPDAKLSPVDAQVVEFVRLPSHANPCENILKSQAYLDTQLRIKAIKAYRQCRSDSALQQLAVWRWQGGNSD